jgi:ATP-dependent Clp protease ATP-binding subunit ClpA
VRRDIDRIIGRGRSGDDADVGITPRTKRVFETAIEEAERLGSRRCADTEHLLLALARSGGVAADILAAHRADEGAVRGQLATLLEREAPELALKLRAPERRRGRRRARR